MIQIKKDDSKLNHCRIDGIFTRQHHCIGAALNAIDEKPDWIFEIGTSEGGFSLLLRYTFPKANIVTIDINNKVKSRNGGILYLLEDCFESELLQNLLLMHGSKMIFCDGGNKIREFNTFAKYLNKDDYILCHDYVKDSETFKREYKGKIWNWHESDFRRIEDTVESYGLVEKYTEHFAPVVWSCFQKQK